MDPLSAIGLAASIVQFVQFGLTVAGRLQEFSSTEVPQSLRSISTQLPLLLNALSRIQSSSYLSTLEFDTKCILKGMISGCNEQVQTIAKMVEEITPREGESLKARVKKVFTSLKYDEKVLAVERNLQTYIQVLILHHVIDEKDVPEKFAEESFFDVREKRVESFVERKKVMGALEETLKDVVWGKTKNPVIVMVAGEKGVGKTQLVLEYAHQSHDLGQFQTVFWIDASSLESLGLGFESIYATIKRSTDGSRQEKIRFVKDFLNDLWHPWLLVLDNYESVTLYNEIMDFLPGQGYGGIILVTHNPSSGLGTVLQIPKFITTKDQAALNSLLVQEVQRKNVDGIKDAVSQGASVDSLLWEQWPVLHRCALFGLNDAVTFLLSCGADPNLPDCKVSNPICWAASSGVLQVVETVLNHEDKIGLYTTQSDSQSAFNTAAEEGYLSIMELLLHRREIKLGAKNRYDETVLEAACKKGHLEIVKFLLDEGVLKEDPSQGKQALLNASSNTYLEIVKLLCSDHNQNLNVMDAQGYTPLHYAARSRDSNYVSNGLELTTYLLSQGASPNLAGKGAGNALSEAATYGHLSIAKLLLEKGADPTQEGGGWNPLTNAIQYKSPQIIDLFLSFPPPNKTEADRKTWLEAGMRYAVRSDDRATVLKLLKAGAGIDAVEPRDKSSPLLIATISGHVKMAQFLLRQKADQNLADEKGRVPLVVAAEKGFETLVRDLIKAGGDKDLKSGEDGDTLLMIAVREGKEGVVKVLLEVGADKEEGNLFGDSVMDLAEEKGDEKIVKLLEGWVVT